MSRRRPLWPERPAGRGRPEGVRCRKKLWPIRGPWPGLPPWGGRGARPRHRTRARCQTHRRPRSWLRRGHRKTRREDHRRRSVFRRRGKRLPAAAPQPARPPRVAPPRHHRLLCASPATAARVRHRVTQGLPGGVHRAPEQRDVPISGRPAAQELVEVFRQFSVIGARPSRGGPTHRSMNDTHQERGRQAFPATSPTTRATSPSDTRKTS